MHGVSKRIGKMWPFNRRAAKLSVKEPAKRDIMPGEKFDPNVHMMTEEKNKNHHILHLMIQTGIYEKPRKAAGTQFWIQGKKKRPEIKFA